MNTLLFTIGGFAAGYMVGKLRMKFRLNELRRKADELLIKAREEAAIYKQLWRAEQKKNI